MIQYLFLLLINKFNISTKKLDYNLFYKMSIYYLNHIKNKLIIYNNN